MDAYDELRFKKQVADALEHVKKILDHARILSDPADVQHSYEDKYLLAEFLSNITLASLHSSLEVLGVGGKAWAQMKEWAQKKSVTLRLSAHESCKYLRETTREVTKSIFGKSEAYTVTTITEHFWSFTASWELSAFVGVEVDNRLVLQSRTGTVEKKTPNEATPRPESVVRPTLDVNITWLLQSIDETGTPKFQINRQVEQCKTPRRNPEVKSALKALTALHNWVDRVRAYIRNEVFTAQHEHGLSLESINDDGIFVPVLPVFESPKESSSPSTPGSLIPPVVMSAFLAEQTRSLESKFKDLNKTFPSDTKLITLVEATLVVICLYIKRVCEAYSQGVDSIEGMLLNQLVAAVGRRVTATDFVNYLTFHNRKIFREPFRPKPFSYAIRRPGYDPEGTLSIESESNPISTVANYKLATRPMKFPINASTQVSFFGDRYLHGYMAHKFGDDNSLSNQLSLCARARQFSSFILLIGRIVSADVFEPKHAIILQNKDDLKISNIPLMLETIPTPKEFKDAIASLSPEQQQFCKAFRSMQLESTLFGVCVVQIKPQLEKLLKLPVDSLTKEIQLTQDLLKLFITYQIPSDLLSYDGPEADSPSTQINQVKEYAKRMQQMLDKAKQEELDQAKMEQEMRIAQLPVPPPPATVPDLSYKRSELDEIARIMRENIETVMQRADSLDTIEAKAEQLSNSAVKFHKNSASLTKRSAPLSILHNIGSMLTPSSASTTTTTTTTTTKPASNSARQVTLPTNQPQPPQPQLQQSQNQSQLQPEPQRESREISHEQPQLSNEPQQQKQQPKHSDEEWIDNSSVVDYTKVPSQLEHNFEAYDSSNALRPTIINPGTEWEWSFQKNLLSKPEKKTIYANSVDKEKDAAFDLLDALTKSGGLSIDHASLHVVIASTHCFDKSIIDTIIKDNINPIEKVENSSLIVASTIHQTPAASLIAPEHLAHITATAHPLLLEQEQE